MCLYICVCVCLCVFVCVHVHAGTLLYRSITWASDCAISPVSPLCSPRRLILPGGMVLMWEAEPGRRGRVTTHIICLRAAQIARPQPLSPLCWLQHLTFGPTNLTFLLFTGCWQSFNLIGNNCIIHWDTVSEEAVLTDTNVKSILVAYSLISCSILGGKTKPLGIILHYVANLWNSRFYLSILLF